MQNFEFRSSETWLPSTFIFDGINLVSDANIEVMCTFGFFDKVGGAWSEGLHGGCRIRKQIGSSEILNSLSTKEKTFLPVTVRRSLRVIECATK